MLAGDCSQLRKLGPGFIIVVGSGVGENGVHDLRVVVKAAQDARQRKESSDKRRIRIVFLII